jgi:hypothetical protein
LSTRQRGNSFAERAPLATNGRPGFGLLGASAGSLLPHQDFLAEALNLI